MRIPEGTRLDAYEILSLIGTGGMGEVYKARDTKLGREVAVKVLPDAFSKDKDRLARFEREARLLASLNHPNIATIHGLEESGDVRFLVLELVPGETLEEWTARDPIPIEEAIPLFQQIAEGLEAAHEKGVIHRDLKPANIKVTPEGKVKILDFGLAKAYAEESPSSNLSESPTLTKGTAVGVILGTAPYMSPEQARGKAVDKRTDIWAFGCVLYEALAARKAFDGDSVADIIGAIVKTEPQWESLPETTPRKIRELLRRCLQKDSRRRLRDMGEAWVAIDEALTGSDEIYQAAVSGLGEERRVRTWKRLALVAMAVALLATGVSLRSLLREAAPATRPVTRTVIPLPPGDKLAVGLKAPLALSPDGRYLAYVVALHDESRQLYLRALDELDAKLIEAEPNVGIPFFSHDSQWLGFESGGGWKVSVSGGAPVKIAGMWTHSAASWGPDERIIYNRSPASGLVRISAEGGEPEVLTVPDRERRELNHRWPELLPGGKAVLFTLTSLDTESFDDASIAVLSLETGEYRVLIEGGMAARYSATGHLLYARAGSLLAVPFDLDELQVKGTPVPVLHGVATSHNTGSAEYRISRDGSLLYAPGNSWGNDRHVILVDREGRSQQQLTDTPRALFDLRVSPDGSSLAITIDDVNLSLWAYDISRRTLTRLAPGFSPVWSPEGNRVAFTSNRDFPRQNLFLLDLDGSGEAERLTTGDHDRWANSWSPDGKILAYIEQNDIWLLPMEGGGAPQPFLQTKFRESYPMFSPNGKWLAYQSNESGRNEIYIRPYPGPGRRLQVSAIGGTFPRWSADGKELFYRNGDNMMVVQVEPEGELRLGKPQLLFERRSVFNDYNVMPDGQSFVMIDDSQAEPAPTQLILVQNWAEELKRLVPAN